MNQTVRDYITIAVGTAAAIALCVLSCPLDANANGNNGGDADVVVNIEPTNVLIQPSPIDIILAKGFAEAPLVTTILANPELLHAERAPRAVAMTVGGETPCGDITGASGQTGLAGGGFSTITESCRAFRLLILQDLAGDHRTTKLATFTHYAGWLPRTILHILTLGVLN